MKRMLKVAAIFMSAAFVMLVLACPQNEPTPTLNPFVLSVDVPTAKRNTALELTVNLQSEFEIKDVVWKEGTHNEGLLFDANAQKASATTDNKKWSFTVTKNATYTVAAKDDGSRFSFTTFSVDCFDYAAPGNVTNLAATYTAAHQKITVMWNNPTDEDFAGLKISWQKDSESYCEPITLDTDTETYTIDSVDDTASYYTVQIKTYDTLGNESNGSYKSVGIASTSGQAYTILPAGTNGTAGISGTYIEFGRWPQTLKSDTVNVDKATSESQEVGMFTYYKGSDGEWYCEALENAYKTEEQYKYSTGTQVKQSGENSYQWFKVEPIKWRVLTDNYSGKKLIFCESGLMANVPYYDCYNDTRNIGSSTIYPNNYKHSRIRAWLNGLSFQLGSDTNSDHNGKGFLQTAFTAEEQAAIVQTTVDNSAASTGYDTSDKIFLLSYTEAANSEYGFTDHTRIRKPTDFALANYAYLNSTEAYGGWFFLRSPYYNINEAWNVNYNGGLNNYSYVISAYPVVVPALSLEP